MRSSASSNARSRSCTGGSPRPTRTSRPRVTATSIPAEMTQQRYRLIAIAAFVVYYLVLISGATVRVTASGLGCKHWPGCKGGHPLPPLNHHSLIEFGNRMVVGGVTIVGLA